MNYFISCKCTFAVVIPNPGGSWEGWGTFPPPKLAGIHPLVGQTTGCGGEKFPPESPMPWYTKTSTQLREEKFKSLLNIKNNRQKKKDLGWTAYRMQTISCHTENLIYLLNLYLMLSCGVARNTMVDHI